ncbi:MAG: hypothetical protein JO307_04390 [Bryobacterales bacterium]|nr:hypothetical protein [Bryobacterales bacterium]
MKSGLKITLVTAGLTFLVGTAHGQSCDMLYDCEVIIDDGPYCDGTFGDFTCGFNGGGISSYSSFYSEAYAECEDNFFDAFWEPQTSARVSSPYGCFLSVTLIGGPTSTEYGMWTRVDGVQAAVYTRNASAVGQTDCLYNGQSRSGTETCGQGALLVREGVPAPA